VLPVHSGGLSFAIHLLNSGSFSSLHQTRVILEQYISHNPRIALAPYFIDMTPVIHNHVKLRCFRFSDSIDVFLKRLI